MNSTYGTFNNGTHRRMIMACVCSLKISRYERYEWCTFSCCSKQFVQTVCLAWLCFALFGSELSLVYFVFSVEMHVVIQQTLKCYSILLSKRCCCANSKRHIFAPLYIESDSQFGSMRIANNVIVDNNVPNICWNTFLPNGFGLCLQTKNDRFFIFMNI